MVVTTNVNPFRYVKAQRKLVPNIDHPAVRIAVEAERERCAKIAENWFTAMGATIAAEIRTALTAGKGET